jgi:hypothetical protein
MKHFLSASLVALLACSNVAQAETSTIQPCAADVGKPCNMNIRGNGPDRAQIHGLSWTGYTYSCAFTVTGGNNPRAEVRIESNGNLTPYPHLIGQKFANGRPLRVTGLPPGPLHAVFLLRHSTAETGTTHITVQCDRYPVNKI